MLPGDILRGREGNGTIKFQGTVSTFSWTVPTAEVWHGFTFAIRTTASLGDTDVDEGETATNSGSWSDPGVNDNVVVSASVGNVTTNANGTWDWSYVTSDGPDDSQSVTITATDKDGDWESQTFPLTVNNVAPTVDLTGPSGADEGDTKSYGFTASDPGDDTFSVVTQTCGANGTLSNPAFDGGTGSGSFDCTFPDGPNSSDVSVQLADSDGANSNTDTITVAIANVAPTVDAKEDQTVLFLDTVSLAPATFADVGIPDTHSATIDWDDGIVEAGSITQGAGSGSVSGSHDYALPGTYTVTVTVTDDDLGTGTDTLTVTVLGARDLKARAIEDLANYTSESKRFEKAIKEIEKSLEAKLWGGPIYLYAEHGNQVFNHEKHAVKELMKVVKDEVTDAAEAAAIAAIADLVAADRILAETALEEARNTPVNDPKKEAKVLKEIEKSENELAKAQDELDEGRPDKAINQYRKAWKHAIQAVKHANK